jgi:RNA-binding protein 26
VETEDAVFGSRFVKVFWHRPMEGQGAPIVVSVATREQEQAGPTSGTVPAGPSSPAAPRPRAKPFSSTPSNPARSADEALVLQQLSELGLLKEKLDTAPADERKDLSSQSHKLNQEMLAKSPQMTVSTSKKCRARV